MKLSALEAKEIMSLERDDITLKYLREIFAIHMGETAPKYNAYDTFTMPAGHLYNESSVETTVGRYFFNKRILPTKYLEKYGYVNKTITASLLKKIEASMGLMMLNNELTTKEYGEYLDVGEWLGMGACYFLAPSYGYDICKPLPEVAARKEELFNQYKKEIKEGNPNVVAKIEKELVELAKKVLKEKHLPSYDFFDAGLGGGFDNSYKKTAIMLGIIENPYTKKLDILKSNFIEGVSKEDFPPFSNLTLLGGYNRGVETQVGGYEKKKMDAALQPITLDDQATDCGTEETLDITIPKSLKNLFLFRYIKEGNNLLQLTEKNIDSYTEKPIKLRSPMCCRGQKICSKCAGDLFYKIGIKNAGLLTNAMAGVVQDVNMAKFHDATVKFNTIDISEFIEKI